MTKIEAEKVIKIMLTADYGCSTCARHLVDQFTESFPEYKELAEVLFKLEYTINKSDHDERKALGQFMSDFPGYADIVKDLLK